MEVASLSPLSPTYCSCRREVRSLPKLSSTLFYCHKGSHIRDKSLRSALNSSQSTLPGIRRKHGSMLWQSSDTKVEVCGIRHDCKFHVQNKFSRDVVVRSELATVGSPEDDYSLSKLKVESRIRGACFYAVTAFTAIFLFLLMLVGHPFVILFDRHRRNYHHFIAKIWSTLTVTPFYKVNFEGLENMPPRDTPAVYVSNHQSFLDIYTLLTLGRSFKFISKTSIFLYPIIGWAMFLLGMIPLKRMDSRSQLDCLKRCMDLIKKGASVFFFPEGTRSKDGKLGSFKKGAFSVAAKTNAPVVPITVIGTGQIMPAGREDIVNPGSVKVVIHRPINGSDPTILCEEARNTIASALDSQE
ncbi:1-acyl-sn-glycerol-3-phosphate acyltransferase 1, chloroplastic isoform X1 [Neltuma alba]|uniref:1-acyl-sn-glycerol-3-phosphate acyltransferase 1, chloroplastic isoform X1 n=2 Tax=Neltuma alba TaxID=207710 RepID=UPI0010A2C57D|nr:1-acyl-sn-glycerol-3-phosphate acyltransferase 1, chloroplastic-like isoform X1 [Prosopis alba]XP_028760863.1 1-acyl-sn-glycerol-3-phosphate acyltransferase 1, chloroplastic-like isoform X1 [Prosopis alba]